ncbi:PREDICTED: protein S100-A12-like [Tinamus guttatus]|uniref:protein S100-A12-like n=1 Tax=Tinamus guttatus TaxID=94827 RepID=UPI00052EAE4F|nr:PREDICTED: protein S100-A12-like [Tinamus guttatus]
MKTDLELALDCAVNVYHQYALRKPLDDYLSRGEFKALLKDTAKPFLDNTKPPGLSVEAYIEQLFTKADKNRDGRLKFTEFLSTLSLMAMDAHKRSHEDPKEPGHDHDHGH